MDIDAVVCKIARALVLEDQDAISSQDWQRICIVSRIGIDRRTLQTWLNVAVVEGLLVPQRAIGRSRAVVWAVAWDKVDKVLQTPTNPQETPSGVEG